MPTATASRTELSSTLRIAIMRLARRLRTERPDNDLTLSQLSALGATDRHGPLTLGELAAHEKVRPPSMTRMVGLLEERGLVTRTPHATDGRQVLIAVTPVGADLLRADRRRREVWLARQLEHLTREELEILDKAAPIIERLAGS